MNSKEILQQAKEDYHGINFEERYEYFHRMLGDTILLNSSPEELENSILEVLSLFQRFIPFTNGKNIRLDRDGCPDKDHFLAKTYPEKWNKKKFWSIFPYLVAAGYLEVSTRSRSSSPNVARFFDEKGKLNGWITRADEADDCYSIPEPYAPTSLGNEALARNALHPIEIFLINLANAYQIEKLESKKDKEIKRKSSKEDISSLIPRRRPIGNKKLSSSANEV